MCSIWISEQTAIISLYNINWLAFIIEKECVYCAVRSGYLNVIWVMCFIWISEQTAIISLYIINRLVFITETECVYCPVGTFLNTFQVYHNDSWVYPVSFDGRNTVHHSALLPVYTVGTAVQSVYKSFGRIFGCDWDPHWRSYRIYVGWY